MTTLQSARAELKRQGLSWREDSHPVINEIELVPFVPVPKRSGKQYLDFTINVNVLTGYSWLGGPREGDWAFVED